jgi:hypothetical protein
VVAVGLGSGKIIIHNLKYDETLMSFMQDWGPVTAMTFRTGLPCFIFITCSYLEVFSLQMGNQSSPLAVPWGT